MFTHELNPAPDILNDLAGPSAPQALNKPARKLGNQDCKIRTVKCENSGEAQLA